MTDLTHSIAYLEELIDPASKVIFQFGSILIAEIHLKPDHKVRACHEINKVLTGIEQLGVQIILAIMNDDDNRYAKLISKGMKTNKVDAGGL